MRSARLPVNAPCFRFIDDKIATVAVEEKKLGAYCYHFSGLQYRITSNDRLALRPVNKLFIITAAAPFAGPSVLR